MSKPTFFARLLDIRPKASTTRYACLALMGISLFKIIQFEFIDAGILWGIASALWGIRDALDH